MKRLFLLASLCLSLSVLSAQTLLEKVLANEINLGFSDGVRYEDGSWIFSAVAYSITPGDSAMSLVVKTDSSFRPLWAKRYQYLRRDDFSCITRLKDGNVLVGGTMRQSFSNQNGGSVYKLDTAGNVIWHKLYDESFDDRVLDIFEQADSSLMIFIRKGVNNQPTKIIHASQTGDIISQREYTFNNTFGLLANTVVRDDSARYYFSGNVFSQGTTELYICAVDESNLLWYKRFRFDDDRGASNFVSAYDPSDQTIIYGGPIADSVGIFVNIWLAKIDLAGDLVWAKEYGGDLGFTENISSIKPQPNGEIMIFGSAFDDQGSEAFTAKLDASGEILWLRGYNPSSPTLGVAEAFALPDDRMLINANSGDSVYLMVVAPDGEAACNNTSLSFNTAVLSPVDSVYPLTVDNPGVVEVSPPLRIYDVSISDSLLCQRSVSIDALPTLGLQVYPNPTEAHLTVIPPSKLEAEFDWEIVDILGKRLRPSATIETGQMRVDVSALSPGMYWLLLRTEEGDFRQRFVRQ
ncbi:MAG: T9SS type A sorting domain-containing protein [Bacteroidota bacterium]